MALFGEFSDFFETKCSVPINYITSLFNVQKSITSGDKSVTFHNISADNDNLYKAAIALRSYSKHTLFVIKCSDEGYNLRIIQSTKEESDKNITEIVNKKKKQLLKKVEECNLLIEELVG